MNTEIMQQSDLADILRVLSSSEDSVTSFGESWSQGRSAFGGIASAFAVNGMRKLLGSPQPMRSLMVSFIAPISPGAVSVSAKIQRQGKNVTQMCADVISNGEIGLQAMGVFGNPRTALHVPAKADFNPTPRDRGIPFSKYLRRLPAFLNYFDGCWVSDGMPFSGNKSRRIGMWVRHKADMHEFPTEKMVAICDIPPPVILSYFDKPPVPASSLTWSLEFVESSESISSDWFYLDYYLEAAANGYSQQSGRIFEENGRLCALSRQCMVYFG